MPALPDLLRSLLSRTRVDRVGAARLLWDARGVPIQIREYTRYCADLLREALHGIDTEVEVALDAALDGAVLQSARGQRPLRVGLQIEHTLVKPGGRDSAGAPEGAVPLPDGRGRYLARVADLDRLTACDVVIDYSQANIEHLRRSGHFEDYLRRVVHVAPLLYPFEPPQSPRPRTAITLFADTAQPRRARFLREANAADLPLRNVRRTFDAARLRALYRDTRVLVNVHQTDHHDTLEELRVLPALLCGVVVVSEDVPLRETVPYAPFIVWAPYGRLVETVRDVLAHYDEYRRAIFDGDALRETIARMRRDNAAGIVATLAAAVARREPPRMQKE
ncbi:hypothetical protein [Chiayiivirga flava]|uniref:Glycosyltransferase family 1 protein n=1 Tax=Chiayiivirga flava TaxID=659595 RepID=A0A7W8G310_9GAMM|nr:hypothetical protein [Chiayiivirga flava]MBB5209240.1 hypothetical protein [Chiayiivirga flava]